MTVLPARTALPALPRWIFAPACAVLGGVAGLGQEPLHYVYPMLAALAAFLWISAGAKSARQAGLWAWLFATGYFAFALRWIVEPFQIDVARHGWMAPFALLFLSSGLALFWGAAGALAHRLGRTPFWRHLALVLALGLAELARGYVLTGFPWAGFAQAMLDTRAVAWLPVLGPNGLGLFVWAIAAMPAAIFLARSGIARALALSPIIVMHALEVARPASIPILTDTPLVRIVQPNAPQHEKWNPDNAGKFFWRQIDFSAAPGTRVPTTPDTGPVRPELIVWPETAIPTVLHLADEALARVQEAAAGTPVVLGMQRVSGAEYFNSLLVVDPVGQVGDVYDKHHLVPFGEYMPFADFFARFEVFGLAVASGYAAGPGPRLVELGGIGTALPLICYEAVFPQHARAPGMRPRLLLQITNDAWFGNYAGPQQHLAQARMRAIEQGLPLVRSANTGISAVIDAHGRVVEQIPMVRAGFADAPLPFALMPTPYAKTGDWPVLMFLVLGFAGLIVARVSRKAA